MSLLEAEQLGFEAAYNGYRYPMNFSEWLKNPALLAAWYRGHYQFNHWE